MQTSFFNARMDRLHPSNQARRPQKAVLALNLVGYAIGALTLLGYGLLGLIPLVVSAAYLVAGALLNIALYA